MNKCPHCNYDIVNNSYPNCQKCGLIIDLEKYNETINIIKKYGNKNKRKINNL